MDEDTEFQYGELVAQERGASSFGWWKRETEGLIGRTLDPVEAVTMFDMVTRRNHG